MQCFKVTLQSLKIYIIRRLHFTESNYQKKMKFDDFLNTINDFGRYQKIRYASICLTYMLPPSECIFVANFL